jgi:hypothetical protein
MTETPLYEWKPLRLRPEPQLSALPVILIDHPERLSSDQALRADA